VGQLFYSRRIRIKSEKLKQVICNKTGFSFMNFFSVCLRNWSYFSVFIQHCFICDPSGMLGSNCRSIALTVNQLDDLTMQTHLFLNYIGKSTNKYILYHSSQLSILIIVSVTVFEEPSTVISTPIRLHSNGMNRVNN
jgi:hypothetical protein